MSHDLSDKRRRWFATGAVGLGIALGAAHLAAGVFWLKFDFREHPVLGLILVLSPCLSFFVLRLMARSRGRDRYDVALTSLYSAAAVGIAINVFTIWVEFIEFLSPYEGGGANIGIGLLIIGTPVIAPAFMFGTVFVVEVVVRCASLGRSPPHS